MAEKWVRFESASWQQGFTALPNTVLFNPELSASATRVYLALLYFAREDDDAYPKQGKLAPRLGMSERCLRDAVRALETAKLIRTVRPGQGKPNRYVLLDPMAANSADLEEPAANDAAPDRQDPPLPIDGAEEEAVKKKSPTSPPKQLVDQVFEHFVRTMGKTGAYTLDDKRRRRILARLRERGRAIVEREGAEFSRGDPPPPVWPRAAEQLCLAIDGALHDPWIMGTKRGSPGYKEIKTILRDNEQVERLMGLAEESDRGDGHPFSDYDR